MLTLAAGLPLVVPTVDPAGASHRPGHGQGSVPVPTITGPITGGLRGRPFGFAVTEPSSFGYVEEEYFISGTARAIGDPSTTAPYTTRIYVLRPADPAAFNGAVAVEWLNVTSQMDAAATWYVAHEHMIREGFAFVGVSAQRAGIDPPRGLKAFDPVRYSPLSHPGDDYSFDIFSQAGQVVRQGYRLPRRQPDPLGGLRPDRLIATGQSQSGSRLGTYINDVHEQARVFDGFLPNTFAAPNVRDDVAPVLWVNSEFEGNQTSRPDGGLFRMWEIAGASHFGWWGLQAGIAAGARSEFGDVAPDFNRENAAQYGELGGGPCPQNYFPDRFAYSAALHHLDQWILTGTPPPSAPRFQRDPSTGQPARDSDGNVLGGLRLPPIDVPVANYIGPSCTLFGLTRPFDPLTLGTRYPSHQAYVDALQAATDVAVAAGYLLPPDAEELMARAEASPIGGT